MRWASFALARIGWAPASPRARFKAADPGNGFSAIGPFRFRCAPPHVGDEIYSIDDYRRRYALYKSDGDLRAAHAAAPWFVSFDDHEVDNDWAGDRDQDGVPAEIFRYRRAAAMQASFVSERGRPGLQRV